jgi:hypothetical protein
MTDSYKPTLLPNKVLKRPIWLGLLLTPLLAYVTLAVLILIGYGIGQSWFRALALATGLPFIVFLCLCVTYAGAFAFGLPYLLFLQRRNWLTTKNVVLGGGVLSGAATAIVGLTDAQQPMQTALIAGFFCMSIGIILGFIFCYLIGIFPSNRH